MRKIGINYYSKLGISPHEFAKKASLCGFGATFTGTPSTNDRAEQYAKAFQEYKLDWESVHAPFGHINDIWLPGNGGDAMVSEIKESIDVCARYDVPISVVHLSSGERAPSITDIGRVRFCEIVEYADKKHIKIAFENQRKLANIAWAFEAFDSASNVGFCWDCGHEGCFTPAREYMPLFGKRLICTHIHDNDGAYNHDLHQIPFDGRLDFYRVAKHIKDSGFAGTLMLELLVDNSDLYNGMSPSIYIERAAEAAKRLRDMIDTKN